ncbi:sigma-70 family RNA polymerase sigma factor [Microbacterium sp. ASV49]|uniref:Sigma-70 family RNA polymerase sigma factor n=1 Tax=Microbacterium candidum TaxID=3041922 RepID=A0ABT7N2K5_9MICO|nr:sigma-70 family RNA polymerase sigma factor [Microbacterium sp. ASV49]MDL9980939.1 sigma-70 family RNA polymerase sigma factor [Microbacterium sp. ASV49]
MTDEEILATRFEEHRPRLTRLAHRMLGSAAEAEDAVQETWLRVALAGDDDVENFAGWLTTITSRVCLNMLRARATRAEAEYDDELPEPFVEAVGEAGDPAATAQLSDAVETALLLVLDRLSPAERVAFVLHDTFDVPFEQIGELLERSPDSARQLASRGRRRVRQETPARNGRDAGGRRVVDAFFAAARDGDFDRLVEALAPDVLLRSDGVASATVIVRGAQAVAGRALMFANPLAILRPVVVDGLPGVLVVVGGRILSLIAFHVRGDRIAEIDAYAGPRLAQMELPSV